MTTDFTLGMAGAGGDGIVSAGEALMSVFASTGYYALMTKSFGSQIRGGESSCRLRVATEPIRNLGGSLDVVVALNWDDFHRFGAELPVGGNTTVIYERASGVRPEGLPIRGVTPAAALPVPFMELARGQGGSEKAKNTVVLGLLCQWLALDGDRILEAVRRRLSRRGEDTVQRAERAFAAGREFAARLPTSSCHGSPLEPASGRPMLLADGNSVCAAAAIFAGCRFFAGYPITPSSEIMQFLGREIWKHRGVMLQVEDEIAGAGAALGASFAGVKAMTATSGPGMSLVSEMLGLASMAELPLVCVDVQRGGPSTGMPTKSEQSDLLQAVFSAHGDVVRPVLAPTCVADTFTVTVEAFNIAERYQTPVILLSDQEIAQRKETFEAVDTTRIKVEQRRLASGDELRDFERFKLTESGISPISHPGTAGGSYLASGIEHNERGAPTASGDAHARMNAKRISKLAPLERRSDLFRIEGDPDAPIGMVAWGSLAGVAHEALELARQDGLRVKLLVPWLLYPVSREAYREFFASVRSGLIVEQSHQGQLHRLLRMFLDLPPGVESLARSGANPISPQELCERVRQMALTLQRHEAPELEPQLG
jgi:2-oxoglutarate/2-oxoacid ferredoxin oxidoreductase subunit alpha